MCMLFHELMHRIHAWHDHHALCNRTRASKGHRRLWGSGAPAARASPLPAPAARPPGSRRRCAPPALNPALQPHSPCCRRAARQRSAATPQSPAACAAAGPRVLAAGCAAGRMPACQSPATALHSWEEICSMVAVYCCCKQPNFVFEGGPAGAASRASLGCTEPLARQEK